MNNTLYNISKETAETIDDNFKKCVFGYHLINSSPINETVWEDINSLVFSSSGIEVYKKSDGSHLSEWILILR
jgi:hypothetical protein